jgi:hypothetical protein
MGGSKCKLGGSIAPTQFSVTGLYANFSPLVPPYLVKYSTSIPKCPLLNIFLAPPLRPVKRFPLYMPLGSSQPEQLAVEQHLGTSNINIDPLMFSRVRPRRDNRPSPMSILDKVQTNISSKLELLDLMLRTPSWSMS